MANKPNPFAHLMPKLVAQATQKPEAKNISESPDKGLTSTSGAAIPISDSPQQKDTSLQVTPQAQRLLGTAPVPTPDQMLSAPEFTESTIGSDLQEIARMNTDSIEPTMERPTNLNVEAARLGQTFLLDSAESVRGVCDALDAKLQSVADSSLSGPHLFDVRNYVQSIMVTLKARPEFDEVIIDSDVRNIMKFVRAIREDALATREVKGERKATRAAKAETTKRLDQKLEAAFGAALSLDLSKLGVPKGNK